MRFLYVTDIHGDAAKYERALEVARGEGVAAVVNGGDLLPRRGGAAGQEAFLRDFVAPHLNEYDATGIEYLACLGNDDIRVLDDLFEEICARHESATNLAFRRYEVDGVEFVGMNWVVDYPFRLKDRCRMDHAEYEFQGQFGSGLLSSSGEFVELEDWFAYARTLPTIEDELKALVRPYDMRRAVYVMHMPPAGLGLDSCGSGECVGSRSVRAFIEHERPRMTLHGHIHESPDMSSSWRAVVGGTTCIQPGQSPDGGPLTYVLIDTEGWTSERRVDAE